MLEKWTQAFNEGKRYKNMTTNLAESLTSILKGTCSLLIIALIKKILKELILGSLKMNKITMHVAGMTSILKRYHHVTQEK